jgi:hypothetical protein
VNINLHIERLVLDGVNITPGERHLLQTSVTNELTQMLNNGGLACNLVEGVTLPRLSTSGIRLNDNKPMKLGQQIAQSVYGGIGRE